MEKQNAQKMFGWRDLPSTEKNKALSQATDERSPQIDLELNIAMEIFAYFRL